VFLIVQDLKFIRFLLQSHQNRAPEC